MLLYKAEGNEARPLLVGLHTWSGGYDQAGGEVVYARWCLEYNWHFIHPHFRGPNWTPQACGSDFVVQDILDAVRYAKRHCKVDSDRVYLVGVSGGGHASLLMAGRAPDVWAGVSAWVPIADLEVWWQQKVDGPQEKYAKHIELAVGGKPHQDADAAARCAKRSPITYLHRAVDVNLDINAGVFDGHSGGSVPFTHSLSAFNIVAAPNDRLSEKFMAAFYANQSLPEGADQPKADPLYGSKTVLFRKVSRNARLTVFQGGHEIVHQAALNWLDKQRRGKSADWDVAKPRELQVDETESNSGT
ncbi:alpha/beta hydrolase family protein [Aeoliella sp. SH292]|uniref:alpha/beta hydrolase family protein n=1 Tax=Aeoliella sp. SH292 TaxID=3454464 RepID=UPI003F9BBC4C